MSLKFFSYEEFDSPDANGSGVNMDNQFLEMLDYARQIANIPFKINSGFRTPEHNATLRHSKPSSSHLKGKAVDIAVRSSSDRFTILSSLIQAGFTRFGVGKTFIHVDNDADKVQHVIWTY